MDFFGSHRKEHKQKEPTSKDDETKTTKSMVQEKSKFSSPSKASHVVSNPASSPEKDKRKDQPKDQPGTPTTASKPIPSSGTPKPNITSPTLESTSSAGKSSADKPSTPAPTSTPHGNAHTDKSHSIEKPKPTPKPPLNPSSKPKPASSSPTIQLGPSSKLVLFRVPKGGLLAMSQAAQNGMKIELPQPSSEAPTSRIEKRCLGRMPSQTSNEQHVELSVWSSSFVYPRIRAAVGIPASTSGELMLIPNFHSLLDVHTTSALSLSSANQTDDMVIPKSYPAPKLFPKVAVQMLPSSKRMRDDDGADVHLEATRKHKDKKVKKSKHRDRDEHGNEHGNA